MTDGKTNARETRPPIQEHEVEQVLKAVWETAARRNPMVLVKMINSHSAIDHMRQMISDCLTKGLSIAETSDHAAKELLNAATRNTQLRETCQGSVSQKDGRSHE
jgi:hypothetical protein